MTTFSDDAKALMCGLFAYGSGTVTSRPPHATVQKHQAAFDELLGAGLIVREPFNQFDVWTYRPTEKLAVTANQFRAWHVARMFA